MASVKKLVSFDPAVAEELELVSRTLGMSQKELIERALDFYFDHTDAIIAQQISRDVREGREKVHDADELFAELGLE